MKNWRFSVNLLAILAVIIMISAMFQPWWRFTMQSNRATDIYPYLVDGPASEYLGYRRSPQMTLLTGILIAATLITLAGSLLKGILARVLMITGGSIVLLGTWRLLVRLSDVAARYDIPLQGSGRATEGGFAQIEVAARLMPGTYLIIPAGILAILAGIIHQYVSLKK